MSNQKTPPIKFYKDHLPTVAGLIACLVGFVVLTGWLFDISYFKSVFPGLVEMKINAAVSFALSGLSLVLLSRRVKRPDGQDTGKLILVLVSVVIVIGSLTILQYLLRRSLGIDQLIVQEEPGAVATYVPGRMSPLAAVGFLLIGFAHLLAYWHRYWSSQFLSLGVILLGISALFGYGFQVSALYSPGPYTAVAFHSAVSFFLLGAGTISLFPDKSLIKTVFQEDIGGFVARRLLPAALIIPLFLGLFILAGQRMGFYGPNTTTLLITISTVIVFTLVIFSSARLLSLIEHERRASEQTGRQEVESAQQRLSFLAKASRILARSLDYEKTLDRVARLSVPFVSDWCAIDLVENDGTIKRVAVKHTEEDKTKIIEELEQRYPSDPNSSRGVHGVIASGNSELLSEISDTLLQEVARNEEHLRLLQALALRSVIIVPLKGSEAVFGAITFATAESGRQFTKQDLELAEELGRRAALAIENAQLYQGTKTQNEELEKRVHERTNELEVANLELRTEITERRRIEIELRESEETLAVLVRTASKLITLLDVNEVYKVICEETARALDVPICNIRLFDSQQKELILAGGFGLPETFWERVLSPPENYKRFLSNDRDHHISITADVQAAADSPNYALFKEYDLRTTVGVSMVWENELIGRLTVATTGKSRDFSESELALLRGLADQAALAIQNARLLDQVQTGGERLRQLNRKLVATQETERRRISKELHDEAGQYLTAMKISLDVLKNRLSDELVSQKEQLIDLAEMTDELMERLRMLAHDLRPPALETLGLKKTLEGLCRQFAARTNLSISFEGTKIPPVPDETTVTIYRLVQEALTNVAKHAQANSVKVKIGEWNAVVVVSIEDNGQGFSIEELETIKTSIDGMGLGGMRERLDFVGGQLEIYSEPGKGTKIIASIPLGDWNRKG